MQAPCAPSHQREGEHSALPHAGLPLDTNGETASIAGTIGLSTSYANLRSRSGEAYKPSAVRTYPATATRPT
jgi:hypothetical protein